MWIVLLLLAVSAAIYLYAGYCYDRAKKPEEPKRYTFTASGDCSRCLDSLSYRTGKSNEQILTEAMALYELCIEESISGNKIGIFKEGTMLKEIRF